MDLGYVNEDLRLSICSTVEVCVEEMMQKGHVQDIAAFAAVLTAWSISDDLLEAVNDVFQLRQVKVLSTDSVFP